MAKFIQSETINPDVWEVVSRSYDGKKKIESTTQRMQVDGGWLYLYQAVYQIATDQLEVEPVMVFVPSGGTKKAPAAKATN